MNKHVMEEFVTREREGERERYLVGHVSNYTQKQKFGVSQFTT